jgi:hypothetical protein
VLSLVGRFYVYREKSWKMPAIGPRPSCSEKRRSVSKYLLRFDPENVFEIRALWMCLCACVIWRYGG